MKIILITESGSEYRLAKEKDGVFSVTKKGENRSSVLVGIGNVFIEEGIDKLIGKLKSSVKGRPEGYYGRPDSFNGIIVDKGDVISLKSIIGEKIFFTIPINHFICKEILMSCPLSLNLLKQNFGFSTKVVEVYIE